MVRHFLLIFLFAISANPNVTHAETSEGSTVEATPDVRQILKQSYKICLENRTTHELYDQTIAKAHGYIRELVVDLKKETKTTALSSCSELPNGIAIGKKSARIEVVIKSLHPLKLAINGHVVEINPDTSLLRSVNDAVVNSKKKKGDDISILNMFLTPDCGRHRWPLCRLKTKSRST